MSRLLSGSSDSDTQAFDLSSRHLLEAAWSALVADSAHGVCLIQHDGTVAAASPVWLNDMGLPAGAEPPAKIDDVVRAEITQEILEHAAKARQTGEPVTLDTVIDDERCLITLRPVAPAGENGPILSTWVRRPADDHPALGDAVSSSSTDDSSLARLTARELEVLRLIGYGLSTADVARALHRSVKTIEWHRVALGNKLGVSNRVELARIAIRTGLTGLGPIPESLTNGTDDRAEAASA
jgi:DNA-binding CsgD family transcriptional regulator